MWHVSIIFLIHFISMSFSHGNSHNWKILYVNSHNWWVSHVGSHKWRYSHVSDRKCQVSATCASCQVSSHNWRISHVSSYNKQTSHVSSHNWQNLHVSSVIILHRSNSYHACLLENFPWFDQWCMCVYVQTLSDNIFWQYLWKQGQNKQILPNIYLSYMI